MTGKENLKQRKKLYFSVITFAAVMLAIVLNLSKAAQFFGWIWSVIQPLVIGGCIAFVINILMVWFNTKVFTPKRIKREGLAQVLSMLSALLVVLVILIVVLWIAIPQLIVSFRLLADRIPATFKWARNTVENFLGDYPEALTFLESMDSSSSSLNQNLMNLFRNILPQTLTQTYAAATQTLGAFASLLIGVMFSLYILMYKKKLERQMRQLCYTYLSKKKANRLLYIAHLTYENFNAFIFGQCLEALILAAMYTVLALLFRLPYTAMIATVFAVFSLIPLFGAWIGWGIGVFLIITVNPWQALTFSIIFAVVSQIEGNFIYPRIVGSSIGLPGIWVLAAVTVGGNMMGIVGMIIAVPIVALIYTLLSEDCQMRLRKHPAVVEEILHKPSWNYYNPETNTFEDEPVHLTNVIQEDEQEEKEKEQEKETGESEKYEIESSEK